MYGYGRSFVCYDCPHCSGTGADTAKSGLVLECSACLGTGRAKPIAPTWRVRTVLALAALAYVVITIIAFMTQS